LGIKSRQVEAIVIGEHGPSQVPIFSSVMVGGKPSAVSSEIRQAIRQQIVDLPKTMEPMRIRTGRTQGWATSMALTNLCRAVSKNNNEVMPCSVVLEGEYGFRGLSLSLPVVLGRESVHEIHQWKLTAEEHEGLENSANTLLPSMRYVEQFIRSM
jgi:malate dehydrogenase